MSDLAQAGTRLMDDAHFSWSLATLDCEDALRAWREAPPEDRRAANLVYRAALDREEAAAQDLERIVDLLTPPARHRVDRMTRAVIAQTLHMLD